MVALDELPPERKISAMEQAVSDPSELVRDMAMHYLTSPNVRDPQVRLHLLQHFAPIAADTGRPRDQRTEALDFIKWAYDSFSKQSDVNDQVLSFVADRMADPDLEVRSSAVQFLGPKLVGLAKKGELGRIHFKDRKSVVQYLEKDAAAGGDDSSHAKKILEVLGDK
jgi:hypothetical protein